MKRRNSIGSWWAVFFSLLLTTAVNAHTVIVYPGWRGNNLHSNGTVEDTNGLSVKRAKNATQDTDLLYPFGMQWLYPCGGLPTSQNRTKWPVKGGAFSFQPGWFPGHKTALIYINLGLGNVPLNMSHPMVPPFQIQGPTIEPYPGTFCLPQVPLPANISVSVGDNATIQIVEIAMHGSALYNCVDITFAEPEDVPKVTRENCFNSSDISANLVYTIPVNSSALSSTQTMRTGLALIPLLLAGYYGNIF